MTARSLFFQLTVACLVIGAAKQLSAQTKEANCDWTSFQRSAGELREARDAALKIPQGEGYTEVSPDAIKQIQAFKNGLLASLEAYFACQPHPLPDPRAIESDLYARLAIPAPTPPKPAVYDPNDQGPWTDLYLSDVTIKVEVVPDTRKLIAVLTTFGIPYGTDAELDIFAPDADDRWAPTVHFTSRPYNSIAGAFTAFDYKIAPADAKGNWFVVATHINPWPTSCWQDLFVDAVRPDTIGMNFELFHNEQNGYVCNDLAPYLRSVTAAGFQIQFSIGSVDESVLSSVSVMTYKVDEDEVTRIQPVALNPVNFADEWIRRPWGDAMDWSSTANLTRLRAMHSRSRALQSADFVANRGCANPSLSEVELAENIGHGPSHFFLVRKTGSSYTMVRVSDRATTSCRKSDWLAKIKDR